MVFVDATVRQNQYVEVRTSRFFCLAAQFIEGTTHAIGTLRRVKQNRNSSGLHAAAIQLFNSSEFSIRQNRAVQSDTIGTYFIRIRHVTAVTNHNAGRRYHFFTNCIDRRIRYLRKELFEVRIQQLRFFRQNSERRIGTHRTYRILAVFCHWHQHANHVFLRIAKGLLLRFQIFYRFDSISRCRRYVFNMNNMFFYPITIGLFRSDAVFNFFIRHNALFRRIYEEHTARFQATFVANIFSSFVNYANFGCHDQAIIVGYIVTRRAKAVTVKHAADNNAIGEAHSSRTIPRFHHETVEFIEIAFFLAHELVLFPRFRNHHRHSVRQATASHVQEFQSVIEHSGVRTGIVYNREYLLNIREEIGLRLTFTGINPVNIAADGVNFTIVNDVTVRMGTSPAREGVRTETRVNHGQGGREIKVRQVQIEVTQLFRRQHPFIYNRLRGQGCNVEVTALFLTKRDNLFFGFLTDNV